MSSIGVLARRRDVEDATALVDAEPGLDESADHQVNPFRRAAPSPKSSLARRRVSTSAPTPGPLPDPAQAFGIGRRASRDQFSVDLVLLDPVVEGRVGGAEIVGGLGDALDHFDERNRSSTELGGIGGAHGLSRSSRPELNK